tara:strand:- start:159 stop:365 length:207 start_codon:yes stop_codon:yes gene_type:complete
MAFKKPPVGLRPGKVEINVKYCYIISSLSIPSAIYEELAREALSNPVVPIFIQILSVFSEIPLSPDWV